MWVFWHESFDIDSVTRIFSETFAIPVFFEGFFPWLLQKHSDFSFLEAEDIK